jgi:TatD DNase family protein
VAVGECGLDYDRTHFAEPAIQQKYFRASFLPAKKLNADVENKGRQLALAKKHHLPLFLHSRAAHKDFVRILREEGFGNDGGSAAGGAGGVVHSFTGSIEECAEYVGLFLLGHCSCSDIEQMEMGFCVRRGPRLLP